MPAPLDVLYHKLGVAIEEMNSALARAHDAATEAARHEAEANRLKAELLDAAIKARRFDLVAALQMD